MTRSLHASSMQCRGQSRQEHLTGKRLIRPVQAGGPLRVLATARVSPKMLSHWTRPGRAPCGCLLSSSAAPSDLRRSLGVVQRRQYPARYSFSSLVCICALHYCPLFCACYLCLCVIVLLYWIFPYKCACCGICFVLVICIRVCLFSCSGYSHKSVLVVGIGVRFSGVLGILCKGVSI